MVFDIDGTISLSDNHHFANSFGIYGFHKNVGNLATKIEQNGYFVIYVTARFRLHHYATRMLVKEINNFGERLPEGPIFTNPEISDMWFKREVINGNSDHFKVLTLNAILNLFPANKKISAGFGNSNTDIVAYSAVGIDQKKIFIINESSEIYCIGDDNKYTYKKIIENIDTILPNFNC